MLIKLITKVKVYAPENIGEMDILIAGGKIAEIEKDLSRWKEIEGVEVLDGTGLIAIPGLIDGHVHVLGGGGEGGFTTRTRELEASDIVSSGVTTVVGCLGTDSASRSMENLMAKIKELKESGLNAYAYTGSYRVPVKTLSGSIERDIVFIEEVIGVGEVAVSDHRSSQPTAHELARIVSEAHVAGMLSGKAGIVNLHIGDGKKGLSLLSEILDETDLPKGQLYPTHTNRSERVFMEAVEYALKGGTVDMTASTTEHFIKEGEVPCAKGLARMLDAGVPIQNITFTSDGGGSLPIFDENGEYVGMSSANVSSLLEAVFKAVNEENVPLEQAIRAATSNPAGILKLKRKGEIKEGWDADIIILDEKDFSIKTVISNGKILLQK
ncbi:MAG TPA: beta-aspartyl-peptidase [Clostridia bacterium]|nr:beta-aspartyl-peptidase [Clostridia bacterium]